MNDLFESIKSISMWFGALAVGWIGNSYVSYHFQKPKIKVQMHNIYLRLDKVPSVNTNEITELQESGIFKVPLDFKEKMEECDFVNPPDTYYDNKEEYIEYLLDAKRSIEIRKLNEVDAESILTQLEINLNTNMMDQFINNWMKLQAVFSMSLLKACVEGEGIDIEFEQDIEYLLGIKHDNENEDVTVDNQHTQDENIRTNPRVEELKRIKLENNQDAYVFYHKKKPVYFRFINHREDTRIFGQKLLAAMLLHDKKNLSRVIEYLKALKWNDITLSNIKEMIINQINGFDKIIIKGMFINSGRTPVAIKGQAEVIIKSNGFKFYHNNKIIQINEDLRLPVCLINEEKGKYENTVIVEGGKAVAFTAQSYKYLSEMDEELFIKLNALYNMEHDCFIECIRLDEDKIIKSESIKYRNFNENDISLR
ncbi:hypothetical protein [Clostridium perfringens]|uniref:hypothetical protein n=1 Tax=Clostridium perfringens TaxID=1502 RepID=UPI0034A1CACD